MKQHPGGHFIFTFRDPSGKLRHVRQKNAVTDYAKTLMLTNALTGTWFIGLIRSFNLTDPNLRVPPFDPVVFTGEPGLDWQEYESYTGARKAWTPVIDPGPPVKATGDTVQFVGFNEAMTFGMAGAFLARTSTKGSGYDTIFAFSTGGSIVTLDDVVDVTYEITI